ncbi:uncharacterized protein BYT42DRAFT_580580 [Radiomyces spectabilis]|uniref:uncharacterized protein n=1 Tax=Radiomyces spectabilis TaxID=64574 RepID=UPI00222019E0|nr:uncharacterized protein BYT42DRAFT_580580 [Radiomyces spectabilis]KAI8371526.1 hypothetical protein BYT42DRAFT_580580 [Radiomyces spectabilis]
MTRERHTRLPSISLLLTLPPPCSPGYGISPSQPSSSPRPSPQQQEAVTLNILPASPKTPQSGGAPPNHYFASKSPSYPPLTLNSSIPDSQSLFPASPYSASSTSPSLSPVNDMLWPPLQGDDPPRRLVRQPSMPSLSPPNTSSFSKLSAWPTLYRKSSDPCPLSMPPPLSPSPSNRSSPSSESCLSLPSSPPSPGSSPLPQPKTAATSHASPSPPQPSVPATAAPAKPAASSTGANSLATTQIILNEDGQPILKRRRGRPPSQREPVWEGGWTFLTPTVWNVNSPKQPELSSSTTSHPSEATMNGTMAAFTSSDMDTVLQVPRKKRGRKPKTHIEGNSCFVWRELTATRTVKVKKPDSRRHSADLRKIRKALSGPSSPT